MWTIDPRGTDPNYWNIVWSRPYKNYEGHHQLFWNLIKQKAHGKILDMGCGSASCWKGTDLDITGFDFSSQAIEEAKKNVKGNFFVADILNHGIEDKFDTVVLSGIINYYQDLSQLREQIKKVIKPGGLILITVNVIQDSPDRVWDMDRIYDEFQFMGKVTAKFYEKVGWLIEVAV